MSIVNVFIEPGIAIVGVDTEGAAVGQRFEISKLCVLSHISAVVAFRGYISTAMYATAGMVGFIGSFDELAEAIPGILNSAQQAASLACDMAGHKRPANFTDVQCALVGFSPALGRMAGHSYMSKPGTFDFDQHFDVSNSIVSPGLDRLPDICADRQGMETLARAQCDYIRETAPDFSAGGRFFIAEVKKGHISVDEAFSFPKRLEQ